MDSGFCVKRAARRQVLLTCNNDSLDHLEKCAADLPELVPEARIGGIEPCRCPMCGALEPGSWVISITAFKRAGDHHHESKTGIRRTQSPTPSFSNAPTSSALGPNYTELRGRGPA